jgi:hypothetical protein
MIGPKVGEAQKPEGYLKEKVFLIWLMIISVTIQMSVLLF